MGAVIRLARESDAGQMLDIYAPLVRETAISFELEPPTEEEFRRRVAATLEYAPWLVCESDSGILGYVYASRFRPRAAYQWTVEVTVYVASSSQRRGIGRALYTSLLECLRVQGFCSAVAVIALPNPASVALHEGLGFRQVGVFPAVGYKLGQWHDVGWWRTALRECPHSPAPPVPPGRLLDSPAWQAAIGKGIGLLRP